MAETLTADLLISIKNRAKLKIINPSKDKKRMIPKIVFSENE